MKSIYLLWSLLAIYFLLSVTTLLAWNHAGRNSITGDEPHYLIIADAIGKHKTLELTRSYEEEFKTQRIFAAGLAAPEAKPSPQNTHAVQGPHGLFSIHNIGLSLLLMIPFLCAGVMGAKIFMIILNGALIIVAWKISALFVSNKNIRFFIVLATCIAFPLIPAANQLFPDILAGILSLSALYWFITAHQKRSMTKEIFLMCSIAFLPWLQIKLTVTAAILLIAIASKIGIETKKLSRPIIFIGIFIFSLCLMAAYNQYAFGKISGPYSNGALVINKTSFMVFVGLLLDQNQGFFMQNPITFVGLAFIGKFYVRSKSTLALSGLVFFSLLIPNALHPNWYGGWSISGRFEWSASIVFMLVTLFGLAQLANSHKRIYRTIISISCVWQIQLFYQYSFQNPRIYNKSASTALDLYSLFYRKIYAWLPALYNSEWAYSYIPNYVWSGVVIVLLFHKYITHKALSGFLNK